ncbi:MAG TPA: hypothetical protein VGR67_08975 [Candidatus Polarisedimenticolia bacterium]|jgi:hypothetical protein|nr:hypothetical protein [Candidatus Polarisedimenticolia bacterium]
MIRRCARFLALALLFLSAGRPAQGIGYIFNRLILWSEPGEAYPRLDRDPATGSLSVLFLGAVPAEGWEPVQARRLLLRGSMFVPGEPVPILRPRDGDPDWASTATEASFDLNGDGIAEIIRARNVVIPDNRSPSEGAERVMVEILEGDRILFGDLIEGPGGSSVRLRSISTGDVNSDSFPDMLVRLESADRGGIAFYSQADLRTRGAATVVVPGFSTTAFRPDRYGIFDLTRTPKDFFGHLPHGARPVDPLCGTARRPVGGDGRGRCLFLFDNPYLGWIRGLQVDFTGDRQIDAYELMFPSGASSLTSSQALRFLTPALGAGYVTEVRQEQNKVQKVWIWRGKRATAQLTASEIDGKNLATSVRLARN